MSTLQTQANQAAIDRLQHVTPLAWQHINFYGRYRFDSDLQPINLAQIASDLAKSDPKQWGMAA